MLKADGTPMSRQQIHMLRKKARGICMICAEPAVGVYCLKHTIAVRERMRKKLKFRRRLLQSASYVAESGAKAALKTKARKNAKAPKAVLAVKTRAKAAKALKAGKAAKASKPAKAVKALKAVKAPARKPASRGRK